MIKIEDYLIKWLNNKGYKMVSVKEYAEIEGIAQRTAYQRIDKNKVNYIQVDGTKILLIKTDKNES